MTTNAGGSDEWVGIDDINVSSAPVIGPPPATVSIGDADDHRRRRRHAAPDLHGHPQRQHRRLLGRLHHRERHRGRRQRLRRRHRRAQYVAASPPAARSRSRCRSRSTATPRSRPTRPSASTSATWSTAPARRRSATARRPARSSTTTSPASTSIQGNGHISPLLDQIVTTARRGHRRRHQRLPRLLHPGSRTATAMPRPRTPSSCSYRAARCRRSATWSRSPARCRSSRRTAPRPARCRPPRSVVGLERRPTSASGRPSPRR